MEMGSGSTKAPLVIAQNVLFHLSPSHATTAFENLVSLMTPRAVLLMEGMDFSACGRS